jgi:4-amino-4-deoxy-L-arabinose transferase-like glycosyltransferase
MGALRRFLAATHSPLDLPIIIAASLMMFLPFLGMAPLFDWDEANFGEAAREMLVSGNFLQVTIGFLPFYEKPPLFFWAQAASMGAFGVNEWAARLPSALAGAATLALLFQIGTRIWNRWFGYLWVLAYAGSFLPSLYFRTGLIDPLFNLLMFASIWNLMQLDIGDRKSEGELKCVLWAGLFAGLAVLTKGPVGVGMPGIVWLVYWTAFRRPRVPPITYVVLFGTVAGLVGASWFAVEMLRHGSAFLVAFVDYQRRLLLEGEAGHAGPIYYHVVVTLIGCFPASIVAFYGVSQDPDATERQRAVRRWMIVIFCCVMVIFSLVTTKIAHYVSLAYIPLTYFTAIALQRFWRGLAPRRAYRIALLALGLAGAVAMIGLPLAMMWKEAWIDLIPKAPDRARIMMPLSMPAYFVVPGVMLLLSGVSAILLFRRRQPFAAHVSLFAGMIATMMVMLPLLMPTVHEFSQGPLLRFVHEARAQDAYVMTLFRSYAQYFYGPITRERSALAYGDPDSAAFIDRLLHGPIDRDAYLIAYSTWSEVPGAEFVRKEGGYALFKRNPAAGAARDRVAAP